VTHPGVGVVGRGAAGTHLLASQSPQVVDNASNVQIVASAGDHIIFIGGTGDVVRATGGTETIHAYRGQNTIVTGAGNDTIRYAGAGNVIDAGAGNNALMDSGGNNTIVLAAGGQGYDDILGYVLQNGDRLDLRHMLAGTGWKGVRAGIGDFVKLTTSGSSTVIKVDPDGAAAGASYAVAKLEASGPVSLNTLLAHAIT
jgi:Ca2+-binding RTX toxin-like protein